MAKTKSQAIWIEKRKKDQFYLLAKKKGYRSRASFKLLQALKKHPFIKLGDKVIDLGAAPGGWLQVARQVVGESGYILGVDVSEIEALPWQNVETIIADVTDRAVLQILTRKIGGTANVVLSDVSPNITGSWEVDHARQIYLARKSLEIAVGVLKKNGNFLVKAFHGPELNALKKEVGKCFDFVRIMKPQASRARSSEVYILALGFRR